MPNDACHEMEAPDEKQCNQNQNPLQQEPHVVSSHRLARTSPKGSGVVDQAMAIYSWQIGMADLDTTLKHPHQLPTAKP